MNELWKKSDKQVYLHSISSRETDSYKALSISFGLCVCACKDKQNIRIWQVKTENFPPRKWLLLQLLQLQLEKHAVKEKIGIPNFSIYGSCRVVRRTYGINASNNTFR